MVFCCTLFGATAQILIKSGANSLGGHPSAADLVRHIFTSLPLFTGFLCYGLSTILLVLALRHGELSLLYPVIALTFVWVTALSVLIFNESLNPYKLAGIAVIVSGIAILGRGSQE
jgi:multidrug transporter EmrE-like cation transporter